MVKQPKDENAPKRPLTAYFSWQNSVREKVTKSMPAGTGFGEMAAKFSSMWKAMSDGQKGPFEKKAKASQGKYAKQMEKYKTTKHYSNFQKVKEQFKVDNVKKSKFKKDENAPTRPQSGYFLFMGDERDDLVSDGMAHKDAVKKLGEMWSSLSAAKKKPYEEKAAKLKGKYDKNLEKYKKTKFFKAYQAEKDEFMANRKMELKKLEDKMARGRSRSKSKSKKPKAPKSRSRSKSAKRKATKPKKSKSRSRSRSKPKAAQKHVPFICGL